MELSTLAVTGSTGKLGGILAQILADRGIGQRLLVRTPSRAPQLPGATVHSCDYGDYEEAMAGLSGVKTLFMVSASESSERVAQHRSFVDAAAAAGVERVIYTSFVGASPEATFTLARDHFATEEHIRRSPMAWTFLRDNFYIDFMASLAGEDGVIRGPAGQGRAAVVARADIALAAAAVLGDPAPHAGRIYDLTGREALSLADVARIVGAARGTEVRYHDEAVAEAYESRASYGAPAWQVDAWVSTYTAIASGELEKVSGDVERLTGTAPRTLAEFLSAGE
ncbi:MAG: SDR family oxidoreductase [Arachnia sp.]